MARNEGGIKLCSGLMYTYVLVFVIMCGIVQVYHSLVRSRNVSVKQTLSLSLHEIGFILQEAGVSIDEELVPIFEDMIQVESCCSSILNV